MRQFPRPFCAPQPHPPPFPPLLLPLCSSCLLRPVVPVREKWYLHGRNDPIRSPHIAHGVSVSIPAVRLRLERGTPPPPPPISNTHSWAARSHKTQRAFHTPSQTYRKKRTPCKGWGGISKLQSHNIVNFMNGLGTEASRGFQGIRKQAGVGTNMRCGNMGTLSPLHPHTA